MALFARDGTVAAIFLGALALVIGWLLFRTHRYLSRQTRDNSPLVRTTRPDRAAPGHHLNAPDDVARWEVQMHEIARELSAQLDSKMGGLRALIADADRAAARLEAATVKPLDAARPPADSEPKPTTQAEALLAAGASDHPADDAGQRQDAPSLERRKEEIYTLSDYGLDAGEIAGRVGSPVGEVELILGLREKR